MPARASSVRGKQIRRWTTCHSRLPDVEHELMERDACQHDQPKTHPLETFGSNVLMKPLVAVRLLFLFLASLCIGSDKTTAAELLARESELHKS